VSDRRKGWHGRDRQIAPALETRRLGQFGTKVAKLFLQRYSKPLETSARCRFSSAVEQRFCKPKVGSSILSTGTNKIKHLVHFL
jgi:hypothetical protein